MPQRFMVLCFPALLKRQADGRYLILNRDRKPLGTATWFDCGFYQALEAVPVGLPEMTPRLAERLSCFGSNSLDEIFLYISTCNPLRTAANMDAYLKRLRLLARLKACPAVSPAG